MKRYEFLLLAVLTVLQFCLPVQAEPIDCSAPILGSWKLDRVYENASGEDRVLLDPESAASVYAGINNVYSFSANGAGVTVSTGEGVFYYPGAWRTEADRYVLSPGDEDSAPGSAMEFIYDADENVLHRYWKDENPDAYYTDLDFVYERIPVGNWQMKQVISTEADAEPTVVDPENAQSLYAGSVDTYCFDEMWTAVVWDPVDGGDSFELETGQWSKAGDAFLYETEGFAMEFVYDTEENILHRYWNEENPEAAWHHLDFVYYEVPVGTWKMVQVVNTGADGASEVLDPESSASLYSESVNVYDLYTDGTFHVALPDGGAENGTWTLDNDDLLMIYEDGFEMQLKYDSKADVLHRYWKDAESDAMYSGLDFIYITF